MTRGASGSRPPRGKRGLRSEEQSAQRSAAAAEVLAALRQGLRKVALYLHQSSGLEDFFAPTLDAVTRFHKQYGSLTLVVKPFDFFFDGESVFRADSQENSITYKLYRAGIRSLTLEAGIVGPDLVALGRLLLKTPMELREEDLASMLWREAIPHVSYLQITSTEDDEEGEGGEENIEALMSYLNKKFSGGEARHKVNFRSFSSSDLELESFLNRTKTHRQLFDPPRASSAAEIAYLRDVLTKEKAATISKGVELLFFLCKHAREPDELQAVEETFVLLLEQLFQHRQFDQIGRLLDAIQRLSVVARDQGAKGFLSLKQTLFKIFLDPDLFQALCDYMDNHPSMREAERYDICAFLRLLGGPMQELMMQALGQVKSTTRRVFLMALLGTTADPQTLGEKLLEGFEKDKTFLVDLLQVGRIIPKTFSREQLEGHLQEGDAEVQRLALSLFLSQYPDELVDMSGGFFKNADSGVLRSLFEVLCQNGQDHEGVAKLLSFVQGKAFKRMTPDDQVALYGVLGRSQTPEVLAWFDDLLGRRSRFFLRGVDHQKRLAVRGLEAFGSFQAQAILKKHDQQEYHSPRIKDEIAHSLAFYHVYIRAEQSRSPGFSAPSRPEERR